MAYTYGVGSIKQNNYDILVRIHDAAGWGSGPADCVIKCDTGVVVTTLGDVCGELSGITWTYGASNLAWCEIGKGNEKPTMKNSEGQVLNLNTGDQLAISENAEITFEDLQVNAANYTELRSLAAADTNVDILFVEIPVDAGTPAAFGVANIRLSVFLEITGNDFNKMVISAKKEAGLDENMIMPITVTRTDD